MTSMEGERQILINEAAELLNRRAPTLRNWERTDILPAELRSRRNDRGWRYWTASQIEGIKVWMHDRDMRPGKGLAHYRPSEEQIERHLEGQRRPRPNARGHRAAA